MTFVPLAITPPLTAMHFVDVLRRVPGWKIIASSSAASAAAVVAPNKVLRNASTRAR